jgi:hypothetical protein
MPIPDSFSRPQFPSLPALTAGPDIGAAVPANLTGEFRLQVGQPYIIAPLIGIDDDRVSAFVVAAKDLQPARGRTAAFPRE